MDEAVTESESHGAVVLAGDPLDAVLTLAEAARLSGLAAHTLTVQAERGRLHARKLGHTWITTRYWLDQYLLAHARRRSAPRTDRSPGPGASDRKRV